MVCTFSNPAPKSLSTPDNTLNFKQYQDYPSNENFEYNPDVSNILDYTPIVHPSIYNYQDRPMTTYNDETTQFYADNQQEIMDNYFYLCLVFNCEQFSIKLDKGLHLSLVKHL